MRGASIWSHRRVAAVSIIGMIATALGGSVIEQRVTAATGLATAERICCQVQVVAPPTRPTQPTLPTPPTPTAPPTTTPVSSDRLALVSCDARAERVVIRNTTGAPASLDGYVLHDVGQNHSVTFNSSDTLQAGATLTITSGLNPSAGPGERVGWRNNVWNNSGDIATLIAPNGTVQTAIC